MRLTDHKVKPHIGGLSRSYDRPYCPQTLRPGEIYGDVILSIQASRHHYCEHESELAKGNCGFNAQVGCAHEPLERYATVEIALFPVDDDAKLPVNPDDNSQLHWVTKPSLQLGIDGFDDLWQGDSVAGYVPLRRVGELQMALALRERGLS